MKTFILRSAILLTTAVAFGNAQATEPIVKAHTNNPLALERALQHQIDRYVVYPVMDRTGAMDGDVAVSFVIDTEGRVNVVRAESPNPALQEYVLQKLAKVDVGSNPDGVWKTTHMCFRFHPEK